MRNVLVTGARGFIGVHLVELLLERGVNVRCLVRDRSNLKDLDGLDAEMVEGDVRVYESLPPAIKGVDTVFHLAGLTSALRPHEMFRTNGKGTANVAKACANASPPPTHVFVSSVAAAGASRDGVTRTELEPPEPISVYGRSKLAGERAAVKWADKVPTTIVRPGIVFGERNRELLPMFYAIDRFHLHPHPNLHSMPLSVIYIRDLVELILKAAVHGDRIVPHAVSDADRAKGYYFACADEHPSYAAWGRMLAAALDRQPVMVVPLLFPLPWVVGSCSEILSRLRHQPSTLNQDKIREANARSWACSPARAKANLGFEPHRPLLAQLRTTVTWYRDNHWL